jgi:hypothetical protein
MSTNTNNIRSFEAASSITKYAVVKFDTAGKIAVADDPTEAQIAGVAQRAGSAGDMIDVVIFGITRVVAGNTITNFATTPILSVTTDGKVEAAVSTDYPLCRVLPNVNQVSAVDGDEIEVYFNGPSVLKA